MILDTSMAGWVLVGSAVFVGGMVQFRLGFGFGLVTLPFAALVFPHHVPQLVLLLGFPVAAAVWLQQRSEVRPSELFWIVIGQGVGIFPGLLVLAVVDGNWLNVIFGVSILVAVGAMVTKRFRPRISAPTQLTAGFVSGMMSVATSLGGPPLALANSRRPPSEFRGIMASALCIANAGALLLLWAVNRIGRDDVTVAASLAVPLVFGSLLGRFVFPKARAVVLRAIVYVIISAAAVAVLLSAARELI